MRRKLRPSGAFHISKACPSAYKVFFSGARGAYIASNKRLQRKHLRLVSACKAAAGGPASMLCR
jgi:hypothetical protein